MGHGSPLVFLVGASCTAFLPACCPHFCHMCMAHFALLLVACTIWGGSIATIRVVSSQILRACEDLHRVLRDSSKTSAQHQQLFAHSLSLRFDEEDSTMFAFEFQLMGDFIPTELQSIRHCTEDWGRVHRSKRHSLPPALLSFGCKECCSGSGVWVD